MIPDTIDAWPSCPDCGKPRHTSCPVCQTAGHEFLPADVMESEVPGDPLVICPICDEPFQPVYLKVCEWCGHQFPDGMAVDPSGVEDELEVNTRVIAALVITTSLVAGLAVYFLVLM